MFFLKKDKNHLKEAKTEALKLITTYMDRWGEQWTHFAIVDGNPFGECKKVTPILAIH